MPPQLFTIELRTAKWDALLDWYRQIAGLRVLVRMPDDGYALLGGPTGKLSLLRREQVEPASGRWSLVLEVDDWTGLLARLAAHDGEPRAVPRQNPEGYWELVLPDPDGNRVRFFGWRGPATADVIEKTLR